MREIKFRAWFSDNGDEPSMLFFDLENGHGFNIPYIVKNSKLMQYTGLKDKNGTEIYEGDIVRQWSSWQGQTTSPTTAVKAVKWHATRPAFNIYSGKHLEVICNIYENKELLHEN